MADKALFHLRRTHNSLLRIRLSRNFFSSDSEPPKQPTHDQQVSFLQAEDQKYLVQTENHINTLIAQIRHLNEHIASQQPLQTVQRDPNIPPYILGHQRARVRDVPQEAQAAIQGFEHIKAHLTDLQYEPYPDSTQDNVSSASNRDPKKGATSESDPRLWEYVIRSLTTGEKEDMLKSMLLEEEAATERLRRDSLRLLQMSKQIEAMSRKGKSVDEPVRHGDPFKGTDSAAAAGDGGGGGGAGRKKAAGSAEAGGKRQGVRAKEKEKEKEREEKPEVVEAPAKSKPAMGLGDLQRKLEQSFTKTGG